MKKIALYVAMALCTLSLQAQHLEFKGHPITGKLADFVKLLEKDGFVKQYQKDNNVYMLGKYVIQDSCIVCVSSLQDTDLVHSVLVYFPENPSFDDLLNQFLDMRSAVKGKYGMYMMNKYTMDHFGTNEQQLKAVNEKEWEFDAFWMLEAGNIGVSISPASGEHKYPFVGISFQDRQGFNLYIKEIRNHNRQRESSLSNDL